MPSDKNNSRTAAMPSLSVHVNAANPGKAMRQSSVTTVINERILFIFLSPFVLLAVIALKQRVHPCSVIFRKRKARHTPIRVCFRAEMRQFPADAVFHADEPLHGFDEFAVANLIGVHVVLLAFFPPLQPQSITGYLLKRPGIFSLEVHHGRFLLCSRKYCQSNYTQLLSNCQYS